jgi:hypothetical protein
MNNYIRNYPALDSAERAAQGTMRLVGLVLLSLYGLHRASGQGDFADEFGMNTGPVEPDREADQSLFATDPTGTDAEQAVPFVMMDQNQFQGHAREQYQRVLNRMNDEATEEGSEAVYYHLTPPDLEL